MRENNVMMKRRFTFATWLLVAALFALSSAFAGNLTPAQRVTLKTFIVADAGLNQMFVDGNLDGLAVALNAAATPDHYVWKSRVASSEIMLNGFDWTRVDNLTVGKARIWEWMVLSFDEIDPSQPNVRSAVEATFSVEAGDAPNRNAVYGHFQRLASRIEKLFATGTGTASTTHGIGPSTMAYEGPIQYYELVGL